LLLLEVLLDASSCSGDVGALCAVRFALNYVRLSFSDVSYSHVAHLENGGALFDRFPAAVRAMAARCKISVAVHPGLSRERSDRIKEITSEMTNERTKEKENGPQSPSTSAHAMKAGVGRYKGPSTSVASS
jgi:hypothetical protein